MIASFKSKALERFWWKARLAMSNQRHVKKLMQILGTLDRATAPGDTNIPGFRFHALSWDQIGRYSLRVDKIGA